MIVKLPVYETVVISSLASFSISLMDFVACAPLSLQQSLLLKIQVVSTFRLWVNQSNDEATTVDPVSIPSTLPMGNSPCNWEQIMNMRNKGVMANLLRLICQGSHLSHALVSVEITETTTLKEPWTIWAAEWVFRAIPRWRDKQHSRNALKDILKIEIPVYW